MGGTSPRPLDGIHVLVVEDNSDAREILSSVLTYHGAFVAAAENVAEAIEHMRTVRPDVIVSDIAMPGMTGIEFIERVRALPDQMEHPTPAIAYSGFVGAEHRERALKHGFHAFLAKPLDPLVIVQEIARLAGRSPEEGRR